MIRKEESEHSSIIDRDRHLRKRRRRATALIAFLLPLVLVPLLPQLLRTWDTPPSTAEAIYVFPGQVPERAECGAKLYRAGAAPLVVFSGGRVDSVLKVVGQPMDDATLNARVATQHGVPPEAEVLLHTGSSTWEDAEALGAWMRQTGVRRILAVTSPTHSRRAQYTLWAALGDAADEVVVFRCGTIYGPLWWTAERSLVRVTLEALKFGYYAIRFLIPSALGFSPGAGVRQPARAPAAGGTSPNGP